MNLIASSATAAAEPLDEINEKQEDCQWRGDYQEVREHVQETDEKDKLFHLRRLDGLSLLLFALDSSFRTAQERSPKAVGARTRHVVVLVVVADAGNDDLNLFMVVALNERNHRFISVLAH